MIVATGLIALSRKVGDERARRKEMKQELLRTIPREDFQASTVSINQTLPYNANTPVMEPMPVVFNLMEQDTQRRGMRRIPVISQTIMNPAYPGTVTISPPPKYSMTSLHPHPEVWKSLPVSSPSLATSTPNLRIRTKGSDLKSGFSYHPGLFELHIRPDVWELFTTEIIEACKLSTKDTAQAWAAGTATALTGALVTSVFVGSSVNRSLQEKKVKQGFSDMGDGGLGDLLRRWNIDVFVKLGLFAHLELSQSALKHQAQRSHTFRKPSMFYSKREDRERKTEERKFCIVVTKLDNNRPPAEAIHEIAEEEAALVELPGGDEKRVNRIELPGDNCQPMELSADMTLDSTDEKDNQQNYSDELEAETVREEDEFGDDIAKACELQFDVPAHRQKDLWPQPLMVNAATHAALNKETQ